MNRMQEEVKAVSNDVETSPLQAAIQSRNCNFQLQTSLSNLTAMHLAKSMFFLRKPNLPLPNRLVQKAIESHAELCIQDTKVSQEVPERMEK